MPVDPIDGGNTPRPDAPEAAKPMPLPEKVAPSSVETAGSQPVSEQELSKVAKKVSPYLEIDHHDPVSTASGKYVRHSSTLEIPPADERPQSARTTPEGTKADNKLRRDARKAGGYEGYDVGHQHPLAAGANPSDAKNVSPQNPKQNRTGTWANEEKGLRAKIENNTSPVTHQVDVVKTPDGQPKWRTSVITDGNGVKTGENVHYMITPDNSKLPAGAPPTAEAAAGKNVRQLFPEAPSVKPVEAAGESVLSAASKDAGALKYAGKGLGILGVAMSAHDLANAGEQSLQQHSVKPIAVEAAKQAGGWAGAWAGAEAGAALGAALGIETGPGAVVTGLVGGVVGGVAGAFGVSAGLNWLTGD